MAMIRRGAEDGVALAMAVMTVFLLSAAAAALLLIASSETIVSAHFRSSVEAQYAAEAAMVRGIALLGAVDDWSGPIAGAAPSTLIDGAPAGTRIVPGGSTVDLGAAVNLANCQKTTACSPSDLATVTVDRPWGDNNPVWQLYAYGPLNALLAPSGGVASSHYVLLLVADDPSGTHRARGEGTPAPPREGIAVRAEAYGPRGAHAVVEVVAGRLTGAAADDTGYNRAASMKILSWREVR
jgi:uncharacterized membrane protein